MGFIDKNLLPQETIVFRTKKHYIIFLAPAIFVMLALFFAADWGWAHSLRILLENTFPSETAAFYFSRLPLTAFTLAAIVTGAKQSLRYFSSDYVVTNKRIIMREGFFERYVTDTRLTTISHVAIEQDLLGQILNYGTIMINNFGGSRDAFITVAAPNLFQKNVQEQLLTLAR